jgi:hypothetical protein
MPLLRDWTDSLKINRLNAAEERFFVRLMMKADDHGRFHADPRLLRSSLFPLRRDVRDTDISCWLAACQTAGLLRCYADANNRAILEIHKFGQRKRFMRASFDPPDGKAGQTNLLLTEEVEVEEKVNEKARATQPDVGRNKNLPGGNGAPARMESAVKMADEALAASSILNSIQSRIGELYRRGPTDAWSYAEQSTLAEVCRRENVIAELEHIIAYRRSMPLDDRKKFFPQSVFSFLNKWNETLDKARMQCPAASPRPKMQSARQSIAPSSGATPEMVRESIAYLENSHPNSPMLPILRKKLEAIRA